MFKKIMAMVLVASAALAAGWWTDGISSYPSPYQFTVTIKPFLYDGIAPVMEGEGVGEYTIKTLLHYLMNDIASSVDVIDSSVNSYNGTAGANTDTLSSAGKINSALAFNGSTDIIYSPAIGNGITDKMSVCFWVKTTSSSYGRVVAGVWGALFIDMQSDGTVRASINNGGWNDLYGSVSVNDGNWHHIALTYSGSTMRLFIDVSLDSSLGLTGNIVTMLGGIKIGADGPNSLPFEGLIDDLRIYDEALYIGEIEEIYNSGNGSEAELTLKRQPDPPPITITFDPTDKGYVNGPTSYDFTSGDYFNSTYWPEMYSFTTNYYWSGNMIDLNTATVYSFSSAVPESSMTLTAEWIEDLGTTVYFDGNGGVLDPLWPSTTVWMYWNYDYIGWPQDPTYEGFTFAGWNTSSDGSGTSIYQYDLYNGSQGSTLYAIWY